MDKTLEKYRVAFVYLGLTIITLVVFWQVHNFEFTNYDDNQYVTQNNHVFTGLTSENIVWAFTSEHSANWHPLTGLSHMLDCQLFDLKAGRHHLVNVLFHIVNTLLLFTVLRRMTCALWQSAFVAALFAIHPLHVESVAWIAERKDVLSTFFWLLTMIAYVRYVKNPRLGTYLLTLVIFALGLMAKPMLVTLPFVLLLLDYWPLSRFETKVLSRLVLEKIPFFVLATVSSIITFFVQKSAGAVGGTELFALRIRIANAIVSYAMYILKLFAPVNLAVFYPHFRAELPLWQILVSAAMLTVVIILVIRFGSKYKYLPAGWFWYLGTLVPVIGMVQVGSQAIADRYTYVPLVGLFIIIAWGANDLTAQWESRKIVLPLSSLAVIFVLSVCAWVQTGYWRNSETLFEHTLKVTPENQLMDNKYGLALMERNKYAEAAGFFQRALQLKPDYAEAFMNLGSAYGQLNRWPEAIKAFKQAIKNNPDFAQAYYNLAVAFCRIGQNTQAIEACQKAIKINPNYANAYTELGIAYSNLGRYAEAVDAFYQAIRSRPDYAKAYFNLALVYSKLNRQQDAIKSFNQAIAADPDYAEAYYNISVIYGNLGRYQDAIDSCRQAIKINPNYAEAYFNLGAAFFRLERTKDAVEAFRNAVRIKPDFAVAHYSLGISCLKAGDRNSAVAEYEILKKLDTQKANALLALIQK